MTTERVGPHTVVTTTTDTQPSTARQPYQTDRPVAAAPTRSSVSNAGTEAIQAGMTVVDGAGEEIGEVRDVKLGDPEAATTEGQTNVSRDAGLVRDAVEAFAGGSEPRIPQPFQDQYLRTGYIRIDSKGFFERDRYASMMMVDTVQGDQVRLSVPKDELLEIH